MDLYGFNRFFLSKKFSHDAGIFETLKRIFGCHLGIFLIETFW
jgi:hypothetical protein